jgi:hypothetical protein
MGIHESPVTEKNNRPSFNFDSYRDIPNLIFMFGVIAVIGSCSSDGTDFRRYGIRREL